jgi:hypothetical protein
MAYIQNMDYLGVTPKNLSDPMRAKTKEWKEGILNPDPNTKYGLWIFGERSAGTSYVGLVVGGSLVDKRRYIEYLDGVHVRAHKLLEDLRGMWTMSQLTRTNSDDIGLFWEAQTAEDEFHSMFNRASLLWVDDFHHETIDMPLWKKYVQPLIEMRVKDKKATIVCTTLGPDDKALPKGVVERLFVTARCTGFRPEEDRYVAPQVEVNEDIDAER